MGGRLVAVGFQFLSCRRFSCLSGLVIESFTIAIPGLRCEKVKWCMALIPLRAACLKGVSKNRKLVPPLDRPVCLQVEHDSPLLNSQPP